MSYISVYKGNNRRCEENESKLHINKKKNDFIKINIL